MKQKLFKQLIKAALHDFDGEEWFDLEFYFVKKHPDWNKKRWDKAMYDGSDVVWTDKLCLWASNRINQTLKELFKTIK